MRDSDLFRRAEAQLRLRHLDEALRLFDSASQHGFDADACAAGRWNCYMLRGDFEHAWQESDQIAQRGKPDPQRFWNGRPLAGRRVLIRCLHGLGDTLQFIRYIPLLRKEARFVAIEVQPALKPLLKEARLADEVITWGDPEPVWDEQIEVIELPRIFRTTVDSIPRNVPYLQLSPPNQNTSERAPRALRVGIAWAAGAYNPARSIPPMELAPLLATPKVSLFSLQDRPPALNGMASLCDDSTPILEVARILETLDLVIAVDTMLAHLAGAMARPVWTLLPYQCDWRWMLERDDSPWYPTMRLFRQPRAGYWRPVIQTVQRALSGSPNEQLPGA